MSTVSIQLENPESGFVELDPPALGRYAEALGRAWQTLGIAAGDRVMIYDYGSSPIAYLASQAFSPYLERGAAELTSSLAVCVDGLPDNAKRVTHVLSYFKPHFLFARADMVPLLVRGPTAVPESSRTATLVVTADGYVPAASEMLTWDQRWQGRVNHLVRWDAAAFVAGLCPACGSLRIPHELYEARATFEAPQSSNGDGAADISEAAFSTYVSGPASSSLSNGKGMPEGADDEGWGHLAISPNFLSMEQITTEIEARQLTPAGCCGNDNRFKVR